MGDLGRLDSSVGLTCSTKTVDIWAYTACHQWMRSATEAEHKDCAATHPCTTSSRSEWRRRRATCVEDDGGNHDGHKAQHALDLLHLALAHKLCSALSVSRLYATRAQGPAERRACGQRLQAYRTVSWLLLLVHTWVTVCRFFSCLPGAAGDLRVAALSRHLCMPQSHH